VRWVVRYTHFFYSEAHKREGSLVLKKNGFVTQVQGVMASYAEFLPNLHDIKGIWDHGSLLIQQS
jgi:hypothetical protein